MDFHVELNLGNIKNLQNMITNVSFAQGQPFKENLRFVLDIVLGNVKPQTGSCMPVVPTQSSPANIYLLKVSNRK